MNGIKRKMDKASEPIEIRYVKKFPGRESGL
jgi:hypothetical protein